MEQIQSGLQPVSPGYYELYGKKSEFPDVRTRDAPRSKMTSFEESKESNNEMGDRDQYARWVHSMGNRMRPIDFQPNGSFKVLKEGGKLVDKNGQLYTEYKGREKQELQDKQFIPGYTGFVRGKQHMSGRTYGETTRRALSADYREVVCTSPVPSAPQCNRKINSRVLHDTFMAQFADKEYHIPGYTGFVPNARHTYSMTYGRNTAQQLSNRLTQTAPRQSQGECRDFARTSFPRKMLTIDSAPLPGATRTQRPPEMYIPSHLTYLNFFPM